MSVLPCHQPQHQNVLGMPYTHKQTHTYASVFHCGHTHTNADTCAHTYTQIFIHINIYTHTYINIHIHTHTQISTHLDLFWKRYFLKDY